MSPLLGQFVGDCLFVLIIGYYVYRIDHPRSPRTRLTGGHNCPKCGDNGCHQCEGD